jgi:hypothetical protein
MTIRYLEGSLRYLEGSLPRLRRELGVDFVVANGENADLTGCGPPRLDADCDVG